MFYKLGLIFFSLSPYLAQSTSFYPVAFPTRVDDAPNVIRGTVIKSQADWSISKDGKKRIYTFTDMQVEEVLKGNISERTIVVKELGGEKDGIGLEIPGTAKFAPGEDIVLFLSARDTDQAYEVRGMSTGKYMVKRDENGKEYIETSADTNHELEKHDEHHDGENNLVKRYSLDQIKELARKTQKDDQTSNTNKSPPASTPTANTPNNSNDTTPVKNTEKPQETDMETNLKQESTVPYWLGGIFFTAILFWLLRRGKK